MVGVLKHFYIAMATTELVVWCMRLFMNTPRLKGYSTIVTAYGACIMIKVELKVLLV